MPKKTQPFSGAAQPNREDAAHQIVTWNHKHLEVLASPGSGKTHTLILRLKHLLHQAVLPQQILVLSFSNEAVRELRRRMDLFCTLKQISNEGVNATGPLAGIRVSTCHAFANSLLRKSSTFMNDAAQRKLLVTAIKSLRQDMSKQTIWADLSVAARKRRRAEVKALLDSVNVRRLITLLAYTRAANVNTSDALAAPLFVGFPAAASVVREVRRRYRALKRKNGSMDYSDMLYQGVLRLRKDKGTEPYTHVLVDEFQDCSHAQIQLFVALAETTRASIMVFGDPFQALYGFAGAQYQGLDAHLKDVVTLRLPVSHRLTRENAALASNIAQLDTAAAIQTYRTGPIPLLITNTNQTEQARQVLTDIQQLLDSGTNLQDIAVLARTKDMLRPVEAELLRAGIDCHRIGINRAHIHVLIILRMVKVLRQWMTEQQPIDPKWMFKFGMAEHKVDADRAAKEATTLMAAVAPTTLEGQYVLCSKAYMRLLGGLRENHDIYADVNRWTQYCRKFTSTRAMRLAIERMAGTGIATSTIHAAKGREWKHVVVVGATDGVLPIYKAKDSIALEEERNILYVAVSRAKDSLRIYHAPTHNSRVRQLFKKLSPFLKTKQTAKLMEWRAGM